MMLKKASVAEIATMNLDDVEVIELVKPGATSGRVVYRRSTSAPAAEAGSMAHRSSARTRLAVVVMNPDDPQARKSLLDVLGKKSSPVDD